MRSTLLILYTRVPLWWGSELWYQIMTIYTITFSSSAWCVLAFVDEYDTIVISTNQLIIIISDFSHIKFICILSNAHVEKHQRPLSVSKHFTHIKIAFTLIKHIFYNNCIYNGQWERREKYCFFFSKMREREILSYFPKMYKYFAFVPIVLHRIICIWKYCVEVFIVFKNIQVKPDDIIIRLMNSKDKCVQFAELL